MSIFTDLPEWNATGTEPDQTKKDEGWKPGEKPPADWFNWLFNRINESFKEIDNPLQKANIPNEWVAISGDYTDHLAFPGFDKFSDGTLGIVYRKSINHEFEESSLWFAKSKDKWGLEWETPILVDNETGFDKRNICLGITDNDTIIFNTGVYNLSTSSWDEPAIFKSTDYGQNWTKTVLTDVTETGMSGFGGMVEADNKHILSLNGTSSDLILLESTDEFATYTKNNVYSSADLPDSSLDRLSETYLIAIDDTTIYGLSRNQGGSTYNRPALEFWSTDGGSTWSNLQYASFNIKGVPPAIYKSGNYVIANWPGRLMTDETAQTDAYLSSGVFNYSIKHIDYITNNSVDWRPPLKTNIHVPDWSNEGDSGYQYMYEVDGELFQIYYKGRTTGTEIYISKLEIKL